MADVITRLRLESTEYDGKLKRAVAQMGQMEQQVRRTGASFAYADKEELAFVQSLGQMGTQVTSAKQKLAEYTNAITSLTATYRGLTDEERNSQFGQAMAQSIEDLKVKAAELKDVMADTQAEISRISSDTGTFDSIVDGIGACVAAFQVAHGAMELFGIKNEEAQQAMVKLQAAMSITIGLTKLQSALQKQSAVMIGITTLQKKAAAAAERMDTAAKGSNIVVTKAATIAQGALNAVAYANPYILLAMAVIGVGAALIGFTKSAGEAEKAQDKNNKSTERNTEDLKKVGESIGGVTAKYKLLKMEWENLTSAQEKTTWIQNNQEAFHQLGLDINSVVDADNAFINNTDKVIAALQARAKATALMELYQEKIKQVYTDAAEQSQSEVSEGGQYYWHKGSITKSTDILKKMEKQALADNAEYGTYGKGIDYRVLYEGTKDQRYELTERGAERLNKYQQNSLFNKHVSAGMGEVDATFSKYWMDAEADAQKKEAALGSLLYKPEDKKKTTTKPAAEQPKEGTIAWQEQEVARLEKEWKNAGDEVRDSYKEQLDAAKKKLEEMKKGVEEMPEPKFSENGIKELQTKFKKQLSEAEFGTTDYIVAADKVADITAFQNLLHTAIENGINIDEDYFQFLFDNINLGVGVDDESWQSLVDDLNTRLEALDLPPIELDVKTGNVKELNKEVSGTIDHVGGAAAAFQALGNAMDQIDDPGAKVAGLIAQSIGSVVAGYGAATAQAATMGPWAWIAFALTGLATMISMVAGIKSATAGSYADGGIIPGNNLSGDNLLASVNSQELVLNRAQTSNLANQLTEGGINNLRLSTDVSGTNLRIVLDNDNRSKGGSRGYYSKIK